MNFRLGVAAVAVSAVVLSCAGDDANGTAQFTYDGHCGAYASLELWRPGMVTASVTGAKGLRCQLVEGHLPSGMQLEPSTCAISGTPLNVESTLFWVRATASNVDGYADRSCSLDVWGPASGYAENLGSNVVHVPGDVFSEWPVEPRGLSWAPAGGESLSYEIASGTLPPGLSLDPSTGRISGVLGWSDAWNTLEWWPFTVRYTATGPLGTVQDDAGTGVKLRFMPFEYGSFVGAVGVGLSAAPSPWPAPNEPGVTVLFSLEPGERLPAGIELDPVTGVISGVPTAPDNVSTGVTAMVTRNGVTYPRRGSVYIYIPAPR